METASLCTARLFDQDLKKWLVFFFTVDLKTVPIVICVCDSVTETKTESLILCEKIQLLWILVKRRRLP